MSGAAGPMSEEDQEDKPHPPQLQQSAFPAAAVVGALNFLKNYWGSGFQIPSCFVFPHPKNSGKTGLGKGRNETVSG